MKDDVKKINILYWILFFVNALVGLFMVYGGYTEFAMTTMWLGFLLIIILITNLFNVNLLKNILRTMVKKDE